MPYILEGKITLRERPEKYFGTFYAEKKIVQPTFGQGEETFVTRHVNIATPNSRVRAEQKTSRKSVGAQHRNARTDYDVHIVSSQIDAFNLTKAGYRVVPVQSMADAQSLCEEHETSFAARRFLAPNSWPHYVAARLNAISGYDCVDGRINLWDVTRFPLPWLSIYARGTLKNIFTILPGRVEGPKYEMIDNGERVRKELSGQGTLSSFGPVLDLGALVLSWTHDDKNIRTHENTYRYGRR